MVSAISTNMGTKTTAIMLIMGIQLPLGAVPARMRRMKLTLMLKKSVTRAAIWDLTQVQRGQQPPPEEEREPLLPLP